MDLLASLQICFYVSIIILSLVYLFLLHHFSYWAKRGVIHEKPSLFYGNLREVGRTQSLREPFRDFYMKFKGKAPFGGFYHFMRRAVVLLDPELIKSVLIKDFGNFAYRGNYYNERDDPLSGHLFNLDGPKWRKLRTKLTPTFTLGKMKFMLPTVVEVAEGLVALIKTQLDRDNNTESCIEIKELLARFTTDVIGSCAFGLECNSLKNPEAQFRLMGKKVFSAPRHKLIVFTLMHEFPNLARKLGMRTLSDDVHQFFMGVVRETVEYRERTQQQRNDFMNILLELKRNNKTEGLTLEEIAAQAFVFFLAGFETSSSTMGFCLYELALNTEVQERARAEINATLQRHKGVFSYECMRELKYLQQIIQETLRLYSILPFVFRKAVNDYAVPNTKHVIERNTVVIIPIDAIHQDPKIYSQPEIFNPDRFSPAALQTRSSVSWLPFGEGPRNCIGMRFGEMQMLVGLGLLLKKFRFSPAPQTPIPLEIDVTRFMLTSKGGITLKVESIGSKF